jgi:hypothetical protein
LIQITRIYRSSRADGARFKIPVNEAGARTVRYRGLADRQLDVDFFSEQF